MNWTSLTVCPLSPLAHSMEYEYLSDVPVLTLDVNEDFKGNAAKNADMIEKVSDDLHNECLLKL